MTDVDGIANIVNMLRAQRLELLDRLDAVDKAIAALSGAGGNVAETPAGTPAMPPDATGVVVPTIVKPRRVLSESHRQALVVSGRRARGAKEAAKGLARDMPDASFVPAIGKRGDSQPPRLVKRAK